MADRSADKLRADLRREAKRRDALRLRLDEAGATIADLAIASKGTPVTYAEIAKILGVSEAAVKKMVSWRRGTRPSRH